MDRQRAGPCSPLFIIADILGRRLSAPKPKLLARNNKTWMRVFGSHSAPPSTALRGQTNIIWQNPTMNRDDVLVWLSLVWFVALCGAAIWVLFFWPVYGS